MLGDILLHTSKKNKTKKIKNKKSFYVRIHYSVSLPRVYVYFSMYLPEALGNNCSKGMCILGTAAGSAGTTDSTVVVAAAASQ